MEHCAGISGPRSFRRNLTIISHALVDRVVLDDPRATVVEFTRRGHTTFARDRREVVLSAGAFGTPHLLHLSGIGPTDHLHNVGITPVVESARVGAN